MKKTIQLIVVASLILFSSSFYAQKKEKKAKIDTKTKNFFRIPTEIKSDDYTLNFKNIVSNFESLKFAVLLNNTTSDYIIWDNKGSQIVFDGGNKNTVKEKIHKLKPHKESNKVFTVRGGDQLLVNKFVFNMTGLSRVPTKGKVQKVEDFKLPASQNSITVGDFTITRIKSKRKTDETYAKFEVVYNGKEVAIVNPNNISVKVNENDIYANDYRKKSAYLLNPGDKMSFLTKFHIPAKVADMQFTDMYIQWNDTFVLSKAIPLDDVKISFEINEELTKERN